MKVPNVFRENSYRTCTLLVCLAAAWPRAACTQATIVSAPVSRPTTTTTRLTGKITIDGHLDDSGWSGVNPLTQFWQRDPVQGQPATQRTEVRIVFDESAIYVGARMYDSLGRDGVRAMLTRRDNLLNGTPGLTSDRVAIVFDSYHDQINARWFELNPLGVKGDEQNADQTYDPVWDGAASIDSLGWTAEFRIPFSQLGFSRDRAQTWGLQIWRYVDRRNEVDMWSFYTKDQLGGAFFYGTLNGLIIESQRRHLELLPYTTARTKFEGVTPGDPFHSRSHTRGSLGGDLKLGVSSNLTLDATINPDFGQVEADPATVNLSDFETTFPERRPFFVANSDFFSFGHFDCFVCDGPDMVPVYWRRIGRAPQLGGLLSDNSSFVDKPDATTILGAAKVTGRTRSGITLGLLEAVTNRASARYRVAGDPADHVAELEPLTNYFAARSRKDFRGGATRIGAIFTLVNRSITDSLERNNLQARAAVTGMDFEHHWHDRTYSLLVQTALSAIGGDSAAVRRAQSSSARYFQRPDRRATTDGIFDVAYDPTRTSLAGYANQIRVAKTSGSWLWEAIQSVRSPGFETNDLGSIQRSDYRWYGANLMRLWTTPVLFLRSGSIDVGGQQQRSYDGDLTNRQLHAAVNAVLPNYWALSNYTLWRPSIFDASLTRGGPIERTDGSVVNGFSVNTDQRQRNVYSAEYDSEKPNGHHEGGRYNLSAGVTTKVTPGIVVWLTPSFENRKARQQFVTSLADANVQPEFGGRRYVFAEVDQKTLSVSSGISATFSPTLTLEVVARPFISSGAFSRYKEFAATRTNRMSYYGEDNGSTIVPSIDPETRGITGFTVDPDGPGRASPFAFANPDFDVRSLHGTAVFRWEYRPGSTLFLVWAQQRSGSGANGEFDLHRDAAAVFADRPTNIFQLKVTYWMGR